MSKILQTTGDELARLAGEMLQPDNTENDHIINNVYICERCGIDFWNNAVAIKTRCTAIDPISITPENAFKWRDWAYENLPLYDLMQSMTEVASLHNQTYSFYSEWWLFEAQPKHYMQAVLLTVERNNK